jgi:hypothetical protein
MEHRIKSLFMPGESTDAYRERLAMLQAEAVERRQQQILEQSSPLNSASVRIRAWERLHQVDLPTNPTHSLVEVIAAKTGLTSDDVRAEQRLRANPPG